MSIIAYPLEATEYTAEDAQTYLSTRTSGVFADDIEFTPKGMRVTVSPFLAWLNYAKFKGCSVAVTEPETLTFSPAHAVLDRIDRIVLRLDLTINKAYLTIIEGEPSSNPVAPEISKNDIIDEISPAYVRIKAGTTEIKRGDISSTILDESVCGIMRDGVTSIPVEQLNAQFYDLLSLLVKEIEEVKDGSAYVLRDGTTAMQANLDVGGYRVKNVADPVENNDAINKGFASNNFASSEWSITTHRINKTGTNANDYITPGLYFFDSDHTPINTPEGIANGWLLVLTTPNTSMKKQVWFRGGTANKNDHETFVRTYIGGWSKWKSYAMKDYVDKLISQVLAKIPEHYNQWEYFYVDGVKGSDNNDGTTAKTAFKTLEKAFGLMNEGRVDLRIEILSPGVYTFERSTFTAIALHIYNESGGEVTVKRSKSGVTAFYQCHINSRGINWEGYLGNDSSYGGYQYDTLYFEGCTTNLTTSDSAPTIRVFPTVKIFGGFLTIANAFCSGLDIKYGTVIFNDVDVEVYNQSQAAAEQSGTYYGIFASMSNIRFKTRVGMGWLADLNTDFQEKYRAFGVRNCTVYFDEGFTIENYRGIAPIEGGFIKESTVFCDARVRDEIIDTLKVTNASNVWAKKYKKTLSVETSDNGNVSLGLSATKYNIKSVTAQIPDGGNLLCNLFAATDWYVNVTKIGTKENVVKTVVQIDVLYELL